MSDLNSRQLLTKLFFPFAAAYFLSYLFRTVNAVVGPVLANDLALPDQALGLLTSTYFLAFAGAQIPLGILLDRYGPRRVESALLVIAAVGASLFAWADSLTGLAIGRAMIGFGVAACLMGALKGLAQWYPPERLASMTGWIMTSGGLGALAAAKPLDLMLGFMSWREVMFFLSGTTLLVAFFLFRQVPDKPSPNGQATLREQLAGVSHIFKDAHFWRYAPLAFFFTGGFMAIQGLWASRWMMVSESLSRPEVAERLTWMSLAMLGGFLFIAFFAMSLARRGFSMARLYAWAMLAACLIFAVLVFYPQWASGLLWPLMAACFSLSNLSYSLVAQHFPLSMAGRANTTLNVLVFAGAFGLQWGIGALVDFLQHHDVSSEAAYRYAFSLLLVGQIISVIWLYWRQRRHPGPH